MTWRPTDSDAQNYRELMGNPIAQPKELSASSYCPGMRLDLSVIAFQQGGESHI